MFRGVELAGKTVLEAMCGSGQTTSFLLSKGATVTGLDVSEESIASFRARWPSCRAIRASVLESNLESEAFDLIVVVGGLHHLHPHISAAIVEFRRLLKPAGFFCFVEPHRGSLPDWVRRRWYRDERSHPVRANTKKRKNATRLIVQVMLNVPARRSLCEE